VNFALPLPLVTLTSDFGMSGGYVAAMRGVILGICPDAGLIDVSHDVRPQDINHASFVLGTTFWYFSASTIHLTVVDPGVGTDRYPILLVTPHDSFNGPNNGIFSHVLTAYGSTLSEPLPADVRILDDVQADVPDTCQAFILDRSEYWAETVSNTFHGRDIFAPVEGHLANGVSAEELGPPIPSLKMLYFPYPEARSGQIEGCVIQIDRFGNLITNLVLEEPIDVDIDVEINGHRISGISRNYQSGEGLLAITGSHGFLEIAYANDKASEHTGASVGTKVTVSFDSSDG
jgi:hypothetical protein